MPPGITTARSSCSATRTIATRSNSPATEYTSETPSMSAIAWAASGISSISHWIRTTAWTLTEDPLDAFEDDGQPLAAGDAERCQAEREPAFAELVGQREEHPSAAHADGVPDRDPAALRVQPVALELQLPLAGDHLRGEGLVDLDRIDVGEGQARLLQHLLRCRHGADAHDPGIHAGPAHADDPSQWLAALGLRTRLAHQDHGRG